MDTIAAIIARQFNHDGHQFQTSRGELLDALCGMQAVRVEEAFGKKRFIFKDGSAITMGDGHWYPGFEHCFCVRADGHFQGCLNQEMVEPAPTPPAPEAPVATAPTVEETIPTSPITEPLAPPTVEETIPTSPITEPLVPPTVEEAIPTSPITEPLVPPTVEETIPTSSITEPLAPPTTEETISSSPTTKPLPGPPPFTIRTYGKINSTVAIEGSRNKARREARALLSTEAGISHAWLIDMNGRIIDAYELAPLPGGGTRIKKIPPGELSKLNQIALPL
ncbi:MAG: hypothetical protein HQL83_11590 [Magnetococcales bacterium]|nr:hypothetical protein [Magnetococcales bacterium]